MKKICIIPARSGSKRLPGKNIKEFHGRPIISYSIELAIKSKLFNEVIVSTDDNEIAEIAKKYGANVPFMRSKKNSNDYATTYDVLEEVIDYYKTKNLFFEYICCLYPAAPLIKEEFMINCFKQILKNKNTTVFPALKFDYPILKAFSLEHENLNFLFPENKNRRTQDTKIFYHDAGQFYWINTNKLFEHKEILTTDSFGLVIPSIYAQDIDCINDWMLAEIKFDYIKKKINGN
jgi:N-acylneuraminate cytidylyltransferase